MSEISRRRRIALALCGVLIAAYVLRPQISDALVLRGDERLYRGRAVDATRYYRRAIDVDPSDGVAVDRYVFAAVGLRRAKLVHDAIDRATRYLRLKPGDDVVRMDRAMALRAVGDWGGALADFARVGIREHDATALTLAGYAALARHQPLRAAQFWKAALSIDDDFVAARHALRRRISRR